MLLTKLMPYKNIVLVMGIIFLSLGVFLIQDRPIVNDEVVGSLSEIDSKFIGPQ